MAVNLLARSSFVFLSGFLIAPLPVISGVWECRRLGDNASGTLAFQNDANEFLFRLLISLIMPVFGTSLSGLLVLLKALFFFCCSAGFLFACRHFTVRYYFSILSYSVILNDDDNKDCQAWVSRMDRLCEGLGSPAT